MKQKSLPFRQYSAVMSQIKLLEEERDTLKREIVDTLEKDGTEKVETEWGKFTVAHRTSYQYSDKVDKIVERLKIAKIREEEKGIAKATETKYLVYTLNKE